MSVRITGVGVELPPDVTTTGEVEARAGLCERLGVEAGWLEQVTGVREHRVADPRVLPSELAGVAAWKALTAAGVDPLDVDTVVFAGATRDGLDVATASIVAAALGARRARVFDVVNDCNGFIDAIDLGDVLIRAGRAERVLVVTGERARLRGAWHAESADEMLGVVTRLVAGDGGGAVVLERSDDPMRGLQERVFCSDPAAWRHAVMHGGDVLTAAVRLLHPALETVMARTGWTYEDLDLVLCHQPTRRFLEHAVTMLGDAARAASKLWWTAERFGNTGTCSLPLALAGAQDEGTLRPGAKVLVIAPSAGVSAAAMTMIW